MSGDVMVARRNLRQYRGRVMALGLAVVFGSVVSLICIGLVARAAGSVQRSIKEGVALRTVEVSTMADRPDVKALQSTNVDAVRSKAHVSVVEPWLQASVGIKTPEVGGALLYATLPRESAQPPVIQAIRTPLFPLRPGEIVVPARSQGENLSALLGKTIPLSYTRKVAENAGEAATDQVTVVGTYDPGYAEDGPSAAYAYRDLVVRWAAARAGLPTEDFLASVGYQRAYVVVDQSRNVDAVVTDLRRDGYSAISIQQRLTALPTGLQAMKVLGIITFVLLMVYSAFSGSAISSSFMKQRTREIGLMNALGFRRARILRVLLLELCIAGAVAGLSGALLGNVISVLVAAAVGGRKLLGVALPTGVAWPDWRWTLLILVAPVVTVVIGGLLPAWRVSRLQPDAALRDQG